MGVDLTDSGDRRIIRSPVRPRGMGGQVDDPDGSEILPERVPGNRCQIRLEIHAMGACWKGVGFGLGWLWCITTMMLAGCALTQPRLSLADHLGIIQGEVDSNQRYASYQKLAVPLSTADPETRSQVVEVLVRRLEEGTEPTASRALIYRALGAAADTRGRPVLLQALDEETEAYVRIEVCQALGQIGHADDVYRLSEEIVRNQPVGVRVEAIKALSQSASKDPRVLQVLIDGMNDRDPAIRLASVESLRVRTGQDHGTSAQAWQVALLPRSDGGSPSPPGQGTLRR